ncbi:hypothetical protein CVT24_013416 [Panaeolus cyanescens]|uniref:G domain-containing protein n=1 Tax=Panaeolus cyanescens TaxID=181874 RepID=A0A409YMM9_9AGAR|nr:hypothetical protein CVT24_013416 [Panaeolus cyanescens]
MMDTSAFRDLKFAGPISVEPQTKFKLLSAINANIILLLGLTGTGKSNFLEVLSGGAGLNISGDSLESVTQGITVYKVVNVRMKLFSEPIFILDCPGFCDDKTSEFKLVTMIQDWMHKTKIMGMISPEERVFSTILYFHRITDKRLASTQKKTLQLLGTLVGDPYFYETGLTVVTTMWDTLWRPTQIQEAEKRFTQLKESLNQIIGPTANQALRFTNTQSSALHIIDDASISCLPDNVWNNIRKHLRPAPFRAFYREILRSAPFADQLLQFLNDRIARLEQSIRILEDDIQRLDQEEHTDLCAREELVDMKKRAEEALGVVVQERLEFLALPESQPNVARRMLNYVQNKLS